MIGLPIIWRLRTLAFAALALAGFGAIECPPNLSCVDVDVFIGHSSQVEAFRKKIPGALVI